MLPIDANIFRKTAPIRCTGVIQGSQADRQKLEWIFGADFSRQRICLEQGKQKKDSKARIVVVINIVVVVVCY